MTSPNHKIHPALGHLSLTKGDEIAFVAFKGATYHLSFIKHILNNAEKQIGVDSSESPESFISQKELTELLWHLRSFFWELTGSFDLMLQWVNDRFALGIREDQLLWRNIPELAGKDQNIWNRVHQSLEDAWNSEWLFEIRMYRNYAHRSFFQIISVINREKGEAQVFLPLAREGQHCCVDIREHLKKYLEEMLKLGAMVFVT
jgi:hypothetical protein